MKKKTILLCWGYNRKNWIEFFEALNDDFEFVYLFYMNASEETEVYTENRRIYYTDYSSPSQLLKAVSPCKVVFMGLDGFQTIALNVQCMRMGIPTYYMTHGSASLSIDDYADFRHKGRNLLKESFSYKLKAWFFTFKFLLRGLGTKYMRELPALLRFQVDKLKMHPLIAMQRNRTVVRIPSKYIVFSKEDIPFYRNLDIVGPEKFIVLGNLEIGKAIKMATEIGAENKGYLLYIETPLSIIEGNGFDINKISIKECNALLSSMNQFAISKRLKFIVKLHPYSYVNTYFIQHPNITYDKSNDKEELILGADYIAFYNSSLAVPALFFKPCCMFTIGEKDEFQTTISSLNICTVMDYKDIINDPLSISFILPDEKAKQAYIDKFIGTGADGKGLDRLRETFLN